MTYLRALSIVGPVAVAVVIAGCNGDGGDATPVATPPDGGTADEHDHDHAGEGGHPTEGPHHGSLVELGDEEYHGEVVHGTDGTVTVYILDGSAKNVVPIDADEVTVNVSHDGQPEQFTLAASPDVGDPEGKSSRFVSTDAELGEHLDEEGAAPKLVVMIEGTSFSGTIEHSHDHEHGHEH